jgi:hypothetical protein
MSWYKGLIGYNKTCMFGASWTHPISYGTLKSDGAKQPIYYPLEWWSQTNMVATPWIPCKTYANLLELWPMMDPFDHPHVEGDTMHNSTHGLC